MDVKVTEGSGLSISKNLLRMSRPGKKLTRKTILLQKKMKDLDKRGNIYTSVLVNLLDIQDSFRSKSPGTAVPDIADVTIQRSDSADSAVSFTLFPFIPFYFNYKVALFCRPEFFQGNEENMFQPLQRELNGILKEIKVL